MAKVYSLHLLSIKAGCSGDEFEEYVRGLLSAAPPLPGVTIRLVKGDRGDRAGKYALLIEFESSERRTELYPTPGPGATDVSAEAMQWAGAVGQQMGQWGEYATPIDVIYTDYEVVAE